MSRAEMADTAAERAVIGACLVADRAIEAASRTITAADFVLPVHRDIFAAIVAQYATGNRVDIVTLGATLGAKTGQYLHELMVETPTSSNAGQYAAIVADWAVRRELVHISSAIADLATGRASTVDAADAVDQAKELLGRVDLPTGSVAPDPDIDSFIAMHDTDYDWLIPGFLERRDRMIVTAGEGAGKSTLLRQIAVCAAAGLHPWTKAQVPPINVTIVDIENQPRQIVRALKTVVANTGISYDPQRLRIASRAGGIDLGSRVDRRWLMDHCIANAAELLVIGPLYRMQESTANTRDPGGEDMARRITAALDDLRVRCDVTLLMETHAPHSKDGFGRDLRPYGSSLWMRWPEFGIGLARKDRDNHDEFEIEHWRGPRDERVWPRELHKRAGKWPWTPVGLPTGTFNNQRGGR